VDVQQLAPGLWRWTALHPDWTPEAAEDGQGWEQEVGCVYVETAGHVLLLDPLVPGEPEHRETFLRHLDEDVERNGKPVAVLLTAWWHRRSSGELAERYGAEIWVRAGGDGVDGPTHEFAPGDALPGGVIAIDAPRPQETLLWLPEHGALVTGDVLLGDGEGGIRVSPDSWLPDGVAPAEFRLALHALLDLPVERILPAHGEPVLHDGLERLRRALAPEVAA
jgi:glyoxylase-like metal-dependent hydrolase (beta-lactamase superfamily II)